MGIGWGPGEDLNQLEKLMRRSLHMIAISYNKVH